MCVLYLETERLVIVTVDIFDNHTYVNNIYLKTDVTIDQIIKDRNILKTKQSIGHTLVELSGSIAYKISEDYRQRGYATEAVQACRDFCLEAGILPFVEISDNNGISQRVASNSGFLHDESCDKDGFGTWEYKIKK
jgi:predicted acetyltransferase